MTTAKRIAAIHADPDLHPKALDMEIRMAPMAVLISLAHDRDAPDDLAEACYNETERRQGAMNRLRTAVGG